MIAVGLAHYKFGRAAQTNALRSHVSGDGDIELLMLGQKNPRICFIPSMGWL